MAKTRPEERIALTAYEAAELLGMCRQTFATLIHKGRIPAVKIGRTWRVHRDVLEDWVKSGVSGPPAKSKRKVAARAARA